MVLLTVLGHASAASAVPTWSALSLGNPSSASASPLEGISCYSLTACAAAGQKTTTKNEAMATTWNGTSWTYATGVIGNPGIKNGILQGVSCTAATTCMTAGAYGTSEGGRAAMAQSQSGTTWTLWNIGIPSGYTRAELWAVSCTTSTWCMGVGDGMVSGDLRAMALGFNGSAWTNSGASPQSNATLRGVSCVSSSFCLAVGSTGALPLAEYWDGSRWTALSTPPVPFTYESAILLGVSCVSTTFCLAVGSLKNSAGVWDVFADAWYGPGTAWLATEIYPGIEGSAQAWGVSCRSSTDCWAIGEAHTTVYRPFASHWTGTGVFWEPLEVPIVTGAEGAQLRGISCTGANECKAAGYDFISGRMVALIETLRP